MASAEQVMESQDGQYVHDQDDEGDGQEVEVQSQSEIEIEVVDDRPEEDRREPVAPEERADDNTELSDEEIERLSKRAQDRIKRLKWEFHEERRAKEAAERMAREAVEYTKRLVDENKRSSGVLQETQKALSEAAKKRAEAAVAVAERKLEAAHDSGDPKAIAAATKELNQATLAQAYAASAPRQVEQRWRQAQGGQAQDGVGDAGAQQYSQLTPEAPPPAPDPKAVEWGQKNTWFGSDVEMTSFAYGVHEKLIRDGVAPDSDEYYSRIDQRMRQVFPDRFEDGGAATTVVDTSSQATAQTPNTVVAPATRSNGAAGPRKIKLTATQVRLAKRLGISKEEYAKQLLKEQQANV